MDFDPLGGMTTEVQVIKVWKKEHKLGTIGIKPSDINPPTEEIRARDFDHEHCAILKKKLQSTGSANAKGIKLVVLSGELETAWLRATDNERLAMFTEGHAFRSAVMALPKYAMGGDHSRAAVTELAHEYPKQEKWQFYKKLTIFVCGTTVDDFQMAKDVGVMLNSKQYHKEMNYADRILNTHKFFALKNCLGKGSRRSPEVAAWCAQQCALGGIPIGSWSQYSAAARLDGNSWLYMEAILKGKYGAAVKRGAFPGVIPTTQSPFVKILSCPPDVIESTLKDVFNGKISVAMLANAADNYKAFALAKEMIIWAVEVANTQHYDEAAIGRAYPFLMTRAFILDFVTPVKAMIKANKNVASEDCPSWIKSKVFDFLRLKEQVNAKFVFTLYKKHLCRRRFQTSCAKNFPTTPSRSSLARNKKSNCNVDCFKGISILSLVH